MNDEGRLSALFDDHYRAVVAYLLRRSDADTAQEVAADVFLVAWRRLDDVPDEPLPWLLVVARHSLANHNRSRRRRGLAEHRLTDRSLLRPEPASTEHVVTERLAVEQALDQLSEADRELLLLVVWDGLSPTEAATVLGCRPGSIRTRLHRARARFAVAFASQNRAIPSALPTR